MSIIYVDNLKLKYVYIDNFKSFKNCFIPLDKFNILVAPNNAGKSNVIQALEFIQIAITRGVETAIDEFGGIETIKNYRNEDNFVKLGFLILRDKAGKLDKVEEGTLFYPEEQVVNQSILSFKNLKTKVDLIVKTDGENFYIKYSIKYEGKFAFVQEKGKQIKELKNNPFDEMKNEMKKRKHYSFEVDIILTQTSPSEEGILYERPKYEFQYMYKGRKEHKNKILRFIGVDKYAKNLPENKEVEINNFPDLEIFLLLRRFPIRTYYFSAHNIKFPRSYKSGTKLNKEGTNISSVLKFLKEKEKDIYERISNSLIGIVAELEGIDVKKDEIGRDKLFFIESLGYGKKKKLSKIPIDVVSDGTINLIATLTALFEPNLKLLLAIEEPERHLHPKAIEYLLSKMRNENKQILITTQSSEVMRNIDFKKDNLIFLFRDFQGNTKAISHKEIPNFERKLKRSGFDIAEFIKNEELGYLGDYLEEELNG